MYLFALLRWYVISADSVTQIKRGVLLESGMLTSEHWEVICLPLPCDTVLAPSVFVFVVAYSVEKFLVVCGHVWMSSSFCQFVFQVYPT